MSFVNLSCKCHVGKISLLISLLASHALAECEIGAKAACEYLAESSVLLQTKAYTTEEHLVKHLEKPTADGEEARFDENTVDVKSDIGKVALARRTRSLGLPQLSDEDELVGNEVARASATLDRTLKKKGEADKAKIMKLGKPLETMTKRKGQGAKNKVRGGKRKQKGKAGKRRKGKGGSSGGGSRKGKGGSGGGSSRKGKGGSGGGSGQSPATGGKSGCSFKVHRQKRFKQVSTASGFHLGTAKKFCLQKKCSFTCMSTNKNAWCHVGVGELVPSGKAVSYELVNCPK